MENIYQLSLEKEKLRKEIEQKLSVNKNTEKKNLNIDEKDGIYDDGNRDINNDDGEKLVDKIQVKNKSQRANPIVYYSLSIF